MSRWLSFGHLLLLSRLDIVIPGLTGDLVIPDLLVIPGLSGNLLRQRLQHRALAASQPCTCKCALTLQPTAAFHHRHPRLRPGILSCLWQGARRALWGGTPRSAQPHETAYSGGGAKISLSPRSILCQYPSYLTFKFFSTISGQNVLDWDLEVTAGNKNHHFCTQPEPQSLLFELTILIVWSFRQAGSLAHLYASREQHYVLVVGLICP